MSDQAKAEATQPEQQVEGKEVDAAPEVAEEQQQEQEQQQQSG